MFLFPVVPFSGSVKLQSLFDVSADLIRLSSCFPSVSDFRRRARLDEKDGRRRRGYGALREFEVGATTKR